MRIMRTLVLALVAIAFIGASAASAQPQPYIGVFFDNKGFAMQKNCPGGGPTLDQVWFILYNANANVAGVEFQVQYPPELLFIADQDMPTQTIPQSGVNIGATPTGISVSWNAVNIKNGFFPVIIGSALVQWQCTFCTAAPPGSPMVVTGHPLFNPASPQWTDWPTNNLHTAIGLTSLICATVPVEETTWGRVKSLYAE